MKQDPSPQSPAPEEPGREAAFFDMPGHQIRRLSQIAVSVFLQRMADLGLDLTPVQYAALCQLARTPGIDQATLAGFIASDRVSLGGVVERLQERGYLLRKPSPHDRRARLIYLTDKGAELVETATPHVIALQEDILLGLSASERQRFMQLLRKVTDAGNALSRAPIRTSD